MASCCRDLRPWLSLQINRKIVSGRKVQDVKANRAYIFLLMSKGLIKKTLLTDKFNAVLCRVERYVRICLKLKCNLHLERQNLEKLQIR